MIFLAAINSTAHHRMPVIDVTCPYAQNGPAGELECNRLLRAVITVLDSVSTPR